MQIRMSRNQLRGEPAAGQERRPRLQGKPGAQVEKSDEGKHARRQPQPDGTPANQASKTITIAGTSNRTMTPVGIIQGKLPPSR